MSSKRSRGPERKHAVALRYHDEMPAPVVVAKAVGASADRLVAIAREHGITVLDRGPVADSLVLLDIGQYVPEELYQVVAELLAFVRKTEIRGAKHKDR